MVCVLLKLVCVGPVSRGASWCLKEVCMPAPTSRRAIMPARKFAGKFLRHAQPRIYYGAWASRLLPRKHEAQGAISNTVHGGRPVLRGAN